MKTAGRRFLTWISVAVLSLFVKGEDSAAAQEKTGTNNQSSTSQLNHKVPPGPHSKTRLLKDKDHKVSSSVSNLSTSSGLKTNQVTQKGMLPKSETSKVGADYTRHKAGSGGLEAGKVTKTSSDLRAGTHAKTSEKRTHVIQPTPRGGELS